MDWEVELKRRHPIVARVDLEAVDANDLHPFRRFVFASDSLSLFGVDAYTVTRQLWERQELAQLITPDLADLISSYGRAVAATDANDSAGLRFYSRVIGKDILKCYRRTAILNGGTYERNIGNIYRQLLGYMPEKQALLGELYDLYAQPSDDRQRLLQVLNAA
jgi:hypothetical protein